MKAAGRKPASVKALGERLCRMNLNTAKRHGNVSAFEITEADAALFDAPQTDGRPEMPR